MPIQHLALTLLVVSMGATGQLLLKMGVSTPAIANAASRLDTITAMATSPGVVIGLILYGGSAALWLFVLKTVDLSVAYPFIGLGFILTMLFGFFLLGEHITPIRIIGTLMIVGGVILVGRSA